MDPQQLSTLVERHVELLGEHFSTVSIFVTLHESDSVGTKFLSKHTGSFFARRDVVREWVMRKDEEVKLEAKRDFDEA